MVVPSAMRSSAEGATKIVLLEDRAKHGFRNECSLTILIIKRKISLSFHKI